MKWIAYALIFAAVAISVFVRLAPVSASSGPGRPAPQPPGDYPSPGGHYAVRAGTEVSLQDLTATIAAHPSARALAEGVYLTRSRFWGFPDVIHLWEEGGNTHVAAHLIYGKSDLGANRARVEAWLAAASR